MTYGDDRNPNRTRLLSKSQAADYLGVCEKTLREMTALGEIPAVNFHGHRRYRPKDLDDFIAKLKPWTDGPKRK